MKVQVQKWGNSLGIRIPASVARDARVTQGVFVEITAKGGKIVLKPARAPRYSLEKFLAEIKPGMLHGETDWGSPQGEEVW